MILLIVQERFAVIVFVQEGTLSCYTVAAHANIVTLLSPGEDLQLASKGGFHVIIAFKKADSCQFVSY